VIGDRVTDLARGPGETRIRDEHARPDLVEQLLFRERARPFLDEDLQQLEGLRRQMHFSAVANELPCFGVEVAVSKPNVHVGLLGAPPSEIFRLSVHPWDGSVRN
jgi:hypothetical protein